MFKGVGTPLQGLTSYDIGWKMLQNTNIPDTRSYGYIYMNGNATATTTSPNNTYVKVAGTTTATKLLKFSTANNRLTYLGKDPIVASVDIVVSGKAPANGAEFTIAVYKNGAIITGPVMNTGLMTNNQSFSLVLNAEVDMVTTNFIEVYIKTTSGTTPISITDMQFRIRD